MSVKNINDPHKVWSRFQAKRKDGSVVKLRIQDYPWGQYKDSIADFCMNYFIQDEAFHKSAGICNSEESKREYQETIFSFYDENQPHVSICCLDDESNTKDILGLSMVQNKSSESDNNNVTDFKPKTKEVQNLFNIISAIHDIKASEGYESCYEGRGIIVRPDHRKMGIANEFVRLRKQICIDNNIQMSCAWMTSISTQKAAAKYNWKTFMELSAEEFEKRTGLPFIADTTTGKVKSKRAHMECEVNGMLATALRVLRLFGLAPVRLTRILHDVYRIRFSRTILILGSIIICFMNLLTISLFSYKIIFESIEKNKTIHTVFTVGLFAAHVISTSATTTTVIWRGSSRINNWISMFSNIEKVRRKVRYDYSLDPKAWKIIITVVASCIINSSFYLLDTSLELIDQSSPKKITSLGAYFKALLQICQNIMIVLQLQYLFLAVILRLTIKDLNSKLRQFIVHEESRMPDDCNKKLRNLSRSYLLIYDVLMELTQSEGTIFIMILFTWVNRVFFTTYILWSTYDTIGTSFYFMKEFIIRTIWLIIQTNKILLLIEPFHRLSNEMEKTKSIIINLLITLPREDFISGGLESIVQQFSSQEPDYTPIAVLKYSRPLFATIVGSVMTFILITNQFTK